jgi:hypothetical protein
MGASFSGPWNDDFFGGFDTSGLSEVTSVSDSMLRLWRWDEKRTLPTLLWIFHPYLDDSHAAGE